MCNISQWNIQELSYSSLQYIDNDFDISKCPPNYLDVLSNFNLTIGYVRQCAINRGFDTIQGYDVYR